MLDLVSKNQLNNEILYSKEIELETQTVSKEQGENLFDYFFLFLIVKKGKTLQASISDHISFIPNLERNSFLQNNIFPNSLGLLNGF